MSACEKCWNDAHVGGEFTTSSVAEEYQRLMKRRKQSPCTPEQQAGEFAGRCLYCGRMTKHQHTGECMSGCGAGHG